ncbi:YDG domain-containing protein [Sphingomonas koreensis]
MSARRSSLFTTSALGALALAAVWSAPAHAQLVQGSTPAQSNGGAPVVDQSTPNTTTVTLSGSRTVIDWDQFDINNGDTANFVFANRSDIVLNRVGGAAGSTINGNLNGRVGAGGPTSGNIWIYNANGVVIGANARINTGGLLVTTAAVDRATDSSAGGFLDGSSTSFGFTGAATGAGITVQNGAQIISRGGAIALVAPVVTTEAGSSISAQAGGNVLYGAASKYKISFRQTGTDDLDLIGFEVAGSADGTGETGGISMGGATSGNRVFAAVVSKTGVIADIVGTGAVTATNIAMDETGAIVLLGNHNLVNGAAGGMVANAGTSDIRLNSGGTLTAPAVSLVTSDSINTNHTTTVSALGGTIDLLAKNGAIFGTGRFNTGTFTAESYGTLWLNGTNNIGTLGGLRNTTNDLVFVGNGNLNIAGDIVSSGEANISVNGVASGSGLIRAPRAVVSGGGTFNLDSATTLRYVSAYAGNLTVNSNGNLRIDLSGAANDYGHIVTLNAASGRISQTSGEALVGRVVANAAGSIDLGANNEYTSIAATSTSGDNINLKGAGNFGFAASTAGDVTVESAGQVTASGVLEAGTLGITAGSINLNQATLDVGSFRYLTSTSGGITVVTASTINIGGDVTAASGNDVTLTSNAGAINQTAGTIAGRQLNIQAAGSIIQNSAAVMNGRGFVGSIVQAGDDLILAGSNRLADYADVTLGWGAGSDVTYRSAYSIFFQTTGVNIGALNLIVDSGSIQQGSAFTANSFSASATGDIDIGSAANNSIARIGNVSSSAGEVRLRVGANNPLAIDGTISSASRVIFTAQGTVSGSGKFSTPGLYLGLIGGGTVNVAGSTNLLELGVSNGDATVRADDSLTLSGALAANGHNLTLIAGTGSITQTGGSFIGMGTLSATAAGAINLSAANSFSGVDATSTGAGIITLNAIGNLDFKARTASAVRVTTGGDATASGANAIDAGALDINAGGKIDLDFTGGSAVFGGLNAGSDVLIAMDGDVVLGGNITAGSGATASLRSRGGAINQSVGTIDATSIALQANTTIGQGTGATLRSTNLSLTSGGNVTLGGANDFTTLTDLAVGGDLTLRNLGNINLSPILGGTGGYRSGGALTLISDTGNLLTTNSGIITSRLNASAAGSINLDGTIASLGTITAGQTILLSTYNGSMDLTGNVTGNSVSLYADTGISQSGGIIDAARLNVITNGAISLTGANQIDVVGRLDTDRYDLGTGHDITLRNVGAIVLDYQVEAPGGTVTLTSDAGGISQTSFSVITAGTLRANALGDIVIDQSANNIANLGASRSSAGILTYADANGFNITGQVRASGNLSLTAGSGAINTSGGGLVATGGLLALSAGSANLIAGGNIQLGTVTTNGNFAIDTDQDITVAGTLSANGGEVTLSAAFGAIGRTGGTIAANKVTATARDGIDIASTGNGLIWAASTGGGDISLTGDADVFFKIDTAGDLTIDAGGYAGSNESVTARSVGINAANGIYLSDQVGTVGSYRYLTSTLGAIDVENKGDIVLAGDVTANASGNYIRLNSTQNSLLQNSGTINGYSVELKAAGSVTQSVNASVVTGAGGLSFTGTDVTLAGANAFSALSLYSVSRDLTLRNVGTLDLSWTSNQAGSARNVTLISDTGNINVAFGVIDADLLTASAVNGSISMTGPSNNIRSLGALTAKSTGGLDINIFTASALSLTGNITAGGVEIQATGSIFQTAGGITADRLTVGTGGSALLLGGANNFGTTTSFMYGTFADVTLRNAGDLNFTPWAGHAVGTLNLISDNGGITQNGAIAATTLFADAATGITLNTAGNNFTTLGRLTTDAGDIRIAETSGFAIEGNITAATGTVALTSTGNITTGTTTVGSVMTPHGKIDADTLTVSATNATVYAAGDIKLGASAVSSGFTLTADGSIDLTATSNFNGASLIATAGSITQSGGILTGNTVLTGANGSITLDKNNNLGDFGGTSFGGGNVTLNNVSSAALSLSLNTTGNAVVTAAGDVLGAYISVNDLSLTAGSIDLRTNVAVNSYSKLVASYGDILVTNSGSFSIAGDVTTNRPGLRSIDLRANSGGISQTAGTISGHYVSLRGSGDLVQSGTARIDSNAAYFNGANVLLGGANSLVSNDTDIVATGNLTLRNAGAIDLTVMGGYTAGGVLSLTSDTGSITATDAVTASALTALAANGAVSFSHADNLIAEIRGLSASTNATVRSRNGGFTLTGNIDVGGMLSLQAGTGINQTGGRIRATTLDAQLYQTMTTGSVLLGGANDVDNLYVLAASGGGDVLFRDTDGFRVTYAVIGNRVTLTSDAGAITQASGYMDGVQANQLTVSAVDGISLNNEWNGIRRILGLTNSGSGGIDVGGRGVNMVLDGNVTAAGQAVSLTSRNASLTQTSGSIIANSLSASAATGISLTSATNNVASLTGLSSTTSGGIAYTDADGYNITGNITAAGQTLSLRSMSASAQILQANSNSVITAGMINLNGGGYYRMFGPGSLGNAIDAIGNVDAALSLNVVGAVDLRGDIVTNYLELRAQGAITQSSGKIENLDPLSQVSFRGASIALTSATNRLGWLEGLDAKYSGSGTGDIALVSLGDLRLGGISANNVSLNAAGNISTVDQAQYRAIGTLTASAGGTIDFSGNFGTLGNVTATGGAGFHSLGNLALTGILNIGTSQLTLTSGGAISQTGGSITAGAINASAATGIDLGRTNYIYTLTGLSTTSGDITYRNHSDIALPTINAPGRLTLTSDVGSITQSIGTTLTANRLIASAANLIELTGANHIASLGALTAGNAITVNNEDSLTLTDDISASSVTLTSTLGAIAQTGGAISASNLTASARTGLDLGGANNVGALHGLSTTFGDLTFRNQGNIVLSDVLALTGTVTLISDSGSIGQSALTAISAERLNASAATGIILDQGNSIARLGTLTNTISGGIRINDATGNLDIAGTVTATGQAVRFDTAGALTQSVALGAYSNLTINAGTGLYLDQANNFGATIFSLSTGSGDITVRNVGNLTLPALTAAGGTIRLISDTGTIGQTGIFTANTLIASARREISLGGNNVITNLGGLVNTSGTITFRDIDGFNITGDIRGSTTTGERVNLIAGGMGDIVQTGGAIVVDRLRATAGGNLTLDGSANSFINVEVLSAGGDITLRAQDSFVLGHTVDAGGTATLTSTNGFIGTDLGSIGHVRADALYVNAATGIDINLPGNITPKVSLVTAAGNIRYTTQGALEFLALKTPDRAIVSADALTQSGAIDVGSLDALAGDIRFDMAGNRIGSIYAAMATGGDLVITDEDGFDIAGNLQASGAISLTAGGTGSITQSDGIITAPTVSLVAAGGDITLDRANAAGVYNARSAIGGTITLRNAGNLTVNAITAQDGTVNLTSNTGSVSQLLVPGNSIWAGKLNVNAAADIDLAARNFTGLLGNLTAGGSIRYNSFMTLGLEGDIRAGGGVTFDISGYLGQYSGTITASHLDVTATGIALIGANDIGSVTASRFSASDDITFRSVNSILLGPVSTPGLLSLTSDNGDIRQTIAFTADRLDAMAAGDIILDQPNMLNTVNDVTAGSVFSLRTNGALELDGRIAADDRVTFNTGGGLTQIGNTVIVTDRLEVVAGTATTTGIRLLNHNRVGAVSLDAGGNDIRFRNTGNIAINAINSPTGTVELISNLGKITQQASGGLVAGSLILNAGNGVELYNADNQIARLDVFSRGNVSIHTGGSGWGGLLTIDRIDAAGQAVSVTNYIAGTIGGNITAASLTVFSAGDTDLGTTNDITGNVALSGRNIIFTNLGNLVIDRVLSSNGNAVLRSEQGAISQTSSALVDTTGLTAYGRDGVTLAGGIRRIDGLSAGAGADVEIVSDRALQLAGDISARNVLLRSNASPGVFDPSGGAITQTGGVITADLFRGSAYGTIDLGRSNQIAALGDVWSFHGGISVTTDRALDLTGAITATGGSVVLNADSITQSGGYIEAAALNARASGALTLDQENRIAATGIVALNAGQDITFRNTDGFVLGMVDTAGPATLTSLNGSITQAASTRVGAGRLTVSAANGWITLDEANLVDTLGGLTAGGDIVFRNSGDFVLDGDVAAAGHEVTLRSNTGAISQTSGTITALGLSAQAGGAITLGGANSVTNLRDVTAGGDFLFRNAGALMLWGNVNAAGHDVTLRTDSGSLLQMLFTSGIITANRLSASAGGALNLNHANQVHALGDYSSGSGVVGFTNDYSFSLTGDISGDELVLTALNGGIRQLSGSINTGSILASARESIDLSGPNRVAAAGPVRLTSDYGDVTFRALGDFTLDFGSAWGTFDVTSDNGNITQSGAINASLLNARAGGSITLTSDNAVTRLGVLTAGATGDIAFTAAGDLLLTDAIDAGGTVALIANAGEITQSGGAITAAELTVSAAQDILLGQANMVAAFAGTSANGDISFRNTGSVSLGTVSLPGLFTLMSDAGAVTQTGDLTAGGLTVTARDGITLTRSGNAAGALVNLTNLGTGGIAYTDSGNILVGSIGAAGQAVTLNAGGDINQTTGIEAAILNLTATGDVTLSHSAGNLIGALGTVDVRRLTLSTAGDLDLAGTIAASDTLSLVVNGRLTQSGGQITTPSLTLQASGIDLGEINQVDTLTANNGGGTGGIRFVNGRSLIASNLSSDGDLTLRVTAGQLTLGGTIFSLGNMDMDAAGDIGGAASIDSRQSVRVVSGGSIDLQSVSGRDDILIDAGGDAWVRELFHLAGAADAAGNGYIVDILGNNVTLGASSSAGVSASNRLYAETNSIVSLGARAGDATLNLATMDHGVSIAATGDVRAFAIDDLNLVNVSGTNVSLSASTGGVGADRVDVAGNYTLNGPAFYRNALQPLGTRAGAWTLATSGDLDALGRTLEFGGGIDFAVDGTLSNGTVRSLAGAVAITAGIVDLYQISAATGIDATANAGDLGLFSADTVAGDLRLTGAAVRVSGALEAGADISVSATTGDAVIGYATAGRNIAVSAHGDATLRQANLTGATGDLTIGAGGNAILGEDDALSGIGADRWFERAAGSTGTATITGGAGASVNLDHSAALGNVSAEQVAINVATGDLSIGQLTATSHGISVDVANGSLTLNSATAANGAVDIFADGDLTLLGGASGLEIYLTAGGLLDTRTAPVHGTDYVELTGGEIRAGTIGSGGDIDALSTAGAITVDSVHSTGGDAIFNAFTDLNLGSVVANGGQLQAGGNAAVRAITAPTGFALVAAGNVTLGADTAGLITGSNRLVTGGSLSGCACGSGGATLISLGGSVNVNLQSAIGVFDTIASAVNGDAIVHVATGDLGIGDLAGHNIAVTLPGGTLTVMNPVSSGGNYILTARDFGGNALLPTLAGGATKLNNVWITDTEGDLGAGGMLVAAGDIRVISVGNITGTLSLLADRDVDVSASAIRLGDVTGRDVALSASTGGVDVVGAVTIGRHYTLTGTGFSANALAMNGTRLGDLLVTDTAGDFDYGTLDLGFAGTATLRANGGAIRGGDITTLGNLSLSAAGVTAGMLRSDVGAVNVDSGAGVDLAGIQASNAIDVSADGDLRLGSAELSGTGVNSFTLAAGGDLVFGAADAAAIGSGNVFTSAGSAMTGAGVQADGAVTINLDRSAAVTGINGGVLELTVRNGGLAIGSIRTVGAISVTGPSGALSIGDIETGAGHINIAGQGNVTTGAVSGRFVVNIGSSAGSVAFRKITGGDVTLAAAGGITATGADSGVFADSLTLSAGGNVDLATNGAGSRIGGLGAITVANGGFVLHNLQDLDLYGAIDVSDGTLDLRVAGALSQSGGSIVAQRLAGDVAGFARLDRANRIGSLGDFGAAGLLFNNAAALRIDGLVDGGAGGVTVRAQGGLTIAGTGSVRSAATGDAIVLASDGLFSNLAGGTALGAANGRWLIYTQMAGNPGTSDPANNFGGLAGRSFYGSAYDFATGSFSTTPNAGNRFVYAYRPVLTVTPNNLTVTYDGQIPVLSATIAGLINGDNAADAWSGVAGFTGAGRNAGTYHILANLGTLASDMNYAFDLGSGTLRIDPRAITATLAASGKIYDGTTAATGTLSLGNVVAGDDVAASGSYAFADKNAGNGKTVTASGIALSGVDAGNYTVNLTATGLADILARAITATLTANGKTYDGTAAATGTLSLGGVLAGDQVGVSGALAFADKNAGTGKTVTASGIALSGADAGNYTVNLTATGLADILARALTATLAANGKIYDGTTAATGTLSLGGVLAGDQVGVSGALAFADKNAGTDKTVTASGIALTGADAGNYVVNATATGLADILARALTATLAANGKTYDGTSAATGALTLGGVVAGDDVIASGSYVFADKNAGAGKTVTASGITLSGVDAGNYTVNLTATGLADILARAITATLAANGKTYDGTMAATGTLSLGGVLAGDQVGVSGALAFADKNAGTGKTVTASGITLSGADAGNYVVNGTASGVADILARAITATLAANGKIYDGTTAATGTLSLGNVVAGDDVAASGSYTFADKNAGIGKTVTASGIALTGADAGNYTVNLTATGFADILARAITATLAANGKTYDGTTAATGTLSLGGVLAGDQVGVSGALAFADKNAGAGKTVTASGIALSGVDAGNYTVNLTATGLADILARAITATLTANGKTYDGTTAATGTLSLGGVLAGDQVGVSGALAFADKNAGTGKTVTASSIALTGADAGNYVVNGTATGLADILARAITATLTANGKIYDGTTAATGTLSLGNMVAGDDVTASGGYAFADKNAGAGKIVTASGITLSGADAGNYTVNLTATGLADILARALTATLAANGKTYDGTTAATGTLSLGGVLAGDQVGVSGALAFADKNAGVGKLVTASSITLSGADAGNYIVNTNATSFADILARAITATLTANGKIYDGTAAATGTLSLGGVLAGDQVGVSGALAFADKNAGAGKTVTASGIALTGADAGNYTVNTTATGLADILARAITATLAANGKTYDGTTAATGTLSLGGVLAGDQVGASGALAFADKNAGTGKTVTASGIALTGADAGNYTVNTTATGLADILARAITATLAANGKIYDGTSAATGTLTLGGVLAGDQVGVSGALAFADKNAGTDKTVTASGIALNGADAGNYVVNGSTTSFADILARAITATLAANGKIYDGTTAVTGTLSLGGVLAGDQVGVSGALAFADKNAGAGKTVTASGITLSGADAGNYTVNTTATSFADILARAITATLAASGKIYDGTTAATGTLSLGNVVAGDDVAASGSYAFADKNAGNGKTVTASGIALSGVDAGNYTVNLTATGLADILARAITATLTANGKTYDGTAAATGTLSLGGVLAGDQVGVSGALAFADKNAGTGKTVTASGIALSGADAGNYTVNLTATGLADILARALTATLAANGKIYDGTTAATGTLSLGGVLAGDQVGVSGALAFADKNAGTDKTVTASGIALTGADAGNYVVNSTAIDTAAIARLAITGTAIADSRIYDGTTAASGRIALNGVLAGDAISANAGYAFADPNAGTSRTVSVNGLTITGADAANYAVTLSANPVLADILLRPVTVTANDFTKLFGQRDPAFTWRIVNGSLVGGDAFTGGLERAPGERAGTYLIGRGSLALSPNYAMTFVPGSLIIRFTPAGVDASDALHRRRPSSAFSLYEDPSANLKGNAGEE